MKNKRKALIKSFMSILALLLIGANFINIELYSKEKIDLLNVEYFKKRKKTQYIIGPGDKLLILSTQFAIDKIDSTKGLDRLDLISQDNSFLLNENQDIYKVNGDGTIFLPRLKNIYVEGLTVSELTYLLNKEYSNFFIEPNITVRIVGYRPISIFIDGEVQNPGLYKLIGEATNALEDLEIKNLKISKDIRGNVNIDSIFPTLYDAIRFSGGITSYSDLSNIQIIRKNSISNGGGKIKATVNFLKVIETGSGEHNIRLIDGDVINIPKSKIDLKEQLSKAVKTNLNPKFIEVILSGRVEQPGKLKLNRSSTLNDAIQVAGGVKIVSGPVNFYRYSAEGLIDKRKFRYNSRSKKGSFKNPVLREGDVIVVGKSTFNKTSNLLMEVTRPFIGINATYDIINKLKKIN